MEIALLPGVLALGETIASHLAHAAACDYQENKGSNARRNPGIYSNPNKDENLIRSHCGIYCNPVAMRGEPVFDPAPTHLESCIPSRPMSANSASETENLSSAPQLRLPAESFKPSKVTFMPAESCDLASRRTRKMSDHSPSTTSLLMPTQERLCPPAPPLLFALDEHKRRERTESPSKEATFVKASTDWSLPPLSLKNVARVSHSTSSTCCSDLDISRSTTVSFHASSSSSPRSVCNDPDSMQLRSPRESEGPTTWNMSSPSKSTAEAPASKARQFCRQAFADCDLENMDDEMTELTKDLEAIRASMAQTRHLLA